MEVDGAIPSTEAPRAGDVEMGEAENDCQLDCYPYTFSPLLLFAQSSYFDKGHSNYNSVAQFFAPALPDVNMLDGVLYDRKNMLYEDLLTYVTTNRMLVPCCIDAHFTAMQVMSDMSAIYYDPLQATLSYVHGESYKKLACFLLLKCNLGDSQHLQDNKAWYTDGPDATPLRRTLYNLWKQIHTLEVKNLNIRWGTLPLDLDRYLLINSRHDPTDMSCQLTGNTCYFQTYLFGVLCKVGQPVLAPGAESIRLHNVDKLQSTTVAISRFLLEFFVPNAGKVMRPLTNSNIVIDFFRYKEAPYFELMTSYLQYLQLNVPDYEVQYLKTLEYFQKTKTLHKYSKFALSGAMTSTLNTKSLQPVFGTDDAVYKLAQSNYYKYRACNFMFGFNTGIMNGFKSFCEFNAWRKNQLLAFYDKLRPILGGCGRRPSPTNKYRDYYFMPQFEVGQQELIDLHDWTYLIDMCAMPSGGGSNAEKAMVQRVNQLMVQDILFSTQKRSNYDKMLTQAELTGSKSYYKAFLDCFMTIPYLTDYMGLGFAEINPREKDINSLTQTVFYSTDLMRGQAYRMEHEFEKECINQMARSTSRGYLARLEGSQGMSNKYRVSIKIGYGFTYSKYNTLMHFLNVMQCYWHNPDLNNIQVFGKDVRALLVMSCQKIFFEKGHRGGFYHYGVLEGVAQAQRGDLDLALATSVGSVNPSVSRDKRGEKNELVLTDRVYEYHYLRDMLHSIFTQQAEVRVKSDNVVLNLCLLSLMLDFGLYDDHAALLNLGVTKRMTNLSDKRQLQVEVANLIHEFDRNNTSDSVTRIKLESLIFEASYKFLVNKGFPVQSRQNELIQQLNTNPAYQQHLLLCKINMSLCQINKSVEVDYYKVRCNGQYRTIIPHNFSKSTAEYLEEVTKRYTFSERDKRIEYGDVALFDLRPLQPEMNLFTVRFDSATQVHSMVKYIEIQNAFQSAESEQTYLVFIADNALLMEVSGSGGVSIQISKISVEVATIFFNQAISFVPCFKYCDSEDVIMFASRNIRYLVDQGGQFCSDYYGMKHELIECINSEEVFVDLNDDHVFKQFKLSELLTESKTVLYFPDYMLQVPNRQELMNLLDLAIHIRNLSFFILVLFYLRRSSVSLEFVAKERHERDETSKITGPWLEAIRYVLNKAPNAHYDTIFRSQFFDLNQHENMPLSEFVDVLCTNFTKYQRSTDDGSYQIVPTEKQKMFLQRIIRSEECFHFSEVGSGKTKVILPLLCQMFLSNNSEAHMHLARGGQAKNVLVVLVPEHLVVDARTQVLRYCLNLNFREEYRVYDDIFALLHDTVRLGVKPLGKYMSSETTRKPMKQIFVTSFNQFKKALTYDKICDKVWPYRENMLVIADEVDDFLDRDKLVFNICSNTNNSFDRPTLELYFEVSSAAYHSQTCPGALLDGSGNAPYWRQLLDKFGAIHAEIQDASQSVNKAFGIFNEQTLRHCSTNIAHDVEGYKSLIARPYESVNRAMPGSYYSDVERTIYLTFVILNEDISKYDELFQQERKFISFEYWSTHVHHIDYDDLVYGHDRLSELASKLPEIKQGLVRFLYEIILRRMEIRDKSRSVNSIDVVFNFDCIGFTGTPFIDNYPTFAYLRSESEHEIPSMIDRSFYVYSSDGLSQAEFEHRFACFQAQNENVRVEYVSSDFVQSCIEDELAILEHIFKRQLLSEQAFSEQACAPSAGCAPGSADEEGLNVVVDLCGIFKRSSIHDVRDLVLRSFGPDRFHYVYHIDQADSSDRVLSVNSDNDVQFDEEFYKFLCNTYGANLREKVFFFVDNRNVIGKDIPFQLVFQRRFGAPLFTKSVVLAHDVDDFSKIWQAMGRSRTMNHTRFCIYKKGISLHDEAGMLDIKTQPLTRLLYQRNCDQKMAGNLSSIYQTLVSLLNLANKIFYYRDEIVNVFLEKMTGSITENVERHEGQLARYVLGSPFPAKVLAYILASKFKRSSILGVAQQSVTTDVMHTLLHNIVQQKYEQRVPSGDMYDKMIQLLSGEQQSLMEISYTKQQQKQKQKQKNKNQDSDTMDVFNRRNQMELTIETDNYFQYTLSPEADMPKIALSLPIAVPILTLTYALENGKQCCVNVYPTLQFLYSHHIQGEYITQEVKDSLKGDLNDSDSFCTRFMAAVMQHKQAGSQQQPADMAQDTEFSVGQTVGIHGLSSSSGLAHNGKRGCIVRPGEDGRWGVRLEDNVGIISFKAENLEVLAVAGASVATNGSSAARGGGMDDAMQKLRIKVRANHIRQNPQYTLAALQEGIYIIGMKDQFNIHDLQGHSMRQHVEYVADEMGFVLYDTSQSSANKSVDKFGPYFIEQYILMEVLSKHEVAQNVLDYYVNHKDKLEESVKSYSEAQGKGFICWRFLMNEAVKAAKAAQNKT